MVQNRHARILRPANYPPPHRGARTLALHLPVNSPARPHFTKCHGCVVDMLCASTQLNSTLKRMQVPELSLEILYDRLLAMLEYLCDCFFTCCVIIKGYWTTCGYANSRIANSRTRQLAYWTSHGLDNSRMPSATLRA